MKKLILAVAITTSCALAQNFPNPQPPQLADGLTIGYFDPSGLTCSPRAVVVLVPSGGEFTCQAGRMATASTATVPSSVVQTLQSNAYTSGTQDFTGASHLIVKNGAAVAKPAFCTVGEVYFATDATAGQNWYFCTATNTWSAQVAGGGSGSPTGVAGGDLSGTFPNPGVRGLNGVTLANLSSGVLVNTTGTGVPRIGSPGTDYVIPSGNVATATALASTPTTCSAGNVPIGVLANGNSTGCAPRPVNQSAVSHQFVTGWNSSTGAFSAAQPAAGDVSGLATSATTDTTNAANIASGTLGAARLPSSAVQNNQANTYSGGGLQDFSSAKFKPGVATVATLPAASSNTNVVYLVTDGASTTDCSTGSGSTGAWCRSNGTSWAALSATGSGSGTVNSGTSNQLAYYTGPGTAVSGLTTLLAAQFPALTGDVTTTAGSLGTTVKGINGTTLSGLATGLLKITTTTGAATSMPLQGTDANVLTAGTVSGTAATLCTDANGGATTVGCTGGGGISGLTTNTIPLATSGTTIGNSQLTQDGTTGQIASAKGFSTPVSAVTFSATPTYDLANGNRFEMTLTGNVSSSTFAHLKAGARFSIALTQDATGGRTNVFPTISGSCPISTTASVTTVGLFEVAADGATVQNLSCVSYDTATLFYGPTRSAPGSPASGSVSMWFDSTANMPQSKDSSGNLNSLVRTASSGTTGQVVDYVQTTGIAHTRQITNADIASANQQGNGTKVQMATGATTTNDCVKFDANGNTVDAGAACGSSSAGGGVNTQTASYTMTSTDSGKLVVMNCSSACTVTMYGSPSSTFYGSIESVGTTTATVSLNGKTFNGSASVPVLNNYRPVAFWSDGTNYFGKAPDVAGTNVTLTAAPNGLTIGSSAGAGGGGCQLANANDYMPFGLSLPAGDSYPDGGSFNQVSMAPGGANGMLAVKLYIPCSWTPNAMAFYLSTAGDASCALSVSIYNSSGTLVVSSGTLTNATTVACNTTGTKYLMSSTTPAATGMGTTYPAGFYTVTATANETAPFVFASATNGGYGAVANLLNAGSHTTVGFAASASTGGASPSTLPALTATAADAPVVILFH